MKTNLNELYDSLFTFEQMLTESIAQCAEVFELAERAGLSHVTNRLRKGIIPQLQEFLDGEDSTSMSSIIEAIETGDTSDTRLQETRQSAAPMQSGNPQYDAMFNRLLESSVEIERTGRTKIKLDELNSPAESEVEETSHPLLEKTTGRPPRQPGQKERVEFDGMENWRSLVNEAAPSRSGGDAGDMVSQLVDFSEATPSRLPKGSPEVGNSTSEIDPSVASILSGL